MTATVYRRLAIAIALLAFFFAAILGLEALARWQLSQHLRHAATTDLASVVSRSTAFAWPFDSDEELIAGRVFGAESFDIDAGVLTVITPATPFEIALRMPRDADTRRYNRLALKLESSRRGTLQLATRERLDGPQFTSKPISLGPGKTRRTLHAATLTWLEGDATPARFGGASDRLATLRLRLHFPAGTRLSVDEVALKRSPKVPRFSLAKLDRRPISADAELRLPAIQLYKLSADTALADVQLARLHGLLPTTPALVILDQGGRPEARLAKRDRIRAALPDAVIVPEEAIDAVLAETTRRVAGGGGSNILRLLSWIAACLYVLLLLRLRTSLNSFENPQVRWSMEAIAAFLAPMVLVAGGMLGDNMRWPAIIALSAALAFALSLPRPQDSARWQLIGTLRAWRDPLLFAGGALLISWWLGGTQAPQTLAPEKLLRYLAWAMIQQYLICVVLADRLLLLSRGNRPLTIAACALLFALLHTPNAALMCATLLGGMVWSACFLRDRSLLPLALSHTIAALALFMFATGDWVRSAEISARFFIP